MTLKNLTAKMNVLSATAGVILFCYMAFATVFGPYKTTFVHLALFALFSFIILFFDSMSGEQNSRKKVAWDVLLLVASVTPLIYFILDFERLINLWGSTYLSTTDLFLGSVFVVVCIEASRRQSSMLGALAILACLYMLFGNFLPGVFSHAGMDFGRFIYTVVYTSEGLFGTGLKVAATYLFMFMVLGSVLRVSKTGDFMIDIANSALGARIGGAAKGAMAASAGLGTIVGSSIGNVVATGTFTIPLMKSTGFQPHVAAAVETNTSEGAQLVPPILGASAFIMVQVTGISYDIVVLAAIIPAALYYLSLYSVVHIEALRHGIKGLPADKIPSFTEKFAAGWHLLIAPIALFCFLLVGSYTVTFASLAAIFIALACGLVRNNTRFGFRKLVKFLSEGLSQSAQITALVISIGLIQASIVSTGLGPRLTDIILGVSDGSLLMTAGLTVVAATILGMGMPTPITYLLLAMFAAPALVECGASILAAHLFLFYFAIKSGSTPPVALVAVVAAAIAEANWFRTAITAFTHSLPGFAVAFMFLYEPGLLFQGGYSVILFVFAKAIIAVIAITYSIQGWCGGWISWFFRVVLASAGLAIFHENLYANLLGFAAFGSIFLFQYIHKSATFNK